jgi:hypothetical protein
VVEGSANVFEIITIDIDVPSDLQYSPTLTVYVYDNIMGIGSIGDRLVGVASIDLYPYCSKVLESLNVVATVLKENLNSKQHPHEATVKKVQGMLLEKKLKHRMLENYKAAEKNGGDDDILENIEVRVLAHGEKSGISIIANSIKDQLKASVQTAHDLSYADPMNTSDMSNKKVT